MESASGQQGRLDAHVIQAAKDPNDKQLLNAFFFGIAVSFSPTFAVLSILLVSLIVSSTPPFSHELYSVKPQQRTTDDLHHVRERPAPLDCRLGQEHVDDSGQRLGDQGADARFHEKQRHVDCAVLQLLLPGATEERHQPDHIVAAGCQLRQGGRDAEWACCKKLAQSRVIAPPAAAASTESAMAAAAPECLGRPAAGSDAAGGFFGSGALPSDTLFVAPSSLDLSSAPARGAGDSARADFVIAVLVR
eukprot:gb/GFBE01035980.1/.p1 GENE.gb/GFBE01035980.1/~~gb/GFBE01035980.1/.p1  ORF type:complete len:248 (+),score=44.70 gb/GFBE01035980.1/:1-744(+)